MSGSADNHNPIRDPRTTKEAMTMELIQLMETGFRRFKQERAKIVSSMNLAEGQIVLLSMLGRIPHCNATDIATHIGITSGAVTGMTDKLVQMGLVNRERSEEDRRVVYFSLTPEGRAVVERIRSEQYRLLVDAIAPVTEEELSHVLGFFRHINTHPAQS